MTIDSTFTTFPTLTSPRLRLRQVEIRDADDLYAAVSDEETMRYFGREPYRSLDEVQASILMGQDNYMRRIAIRWGVTLKDDDRIIGTCTFHHFDERFRRAEVGYILNRAYWGQGLMSEAVSTVLRYGFTEMELHRIEAIIDIANERSKNLLLKLGFQYEGNLRQRYYQSGRFEDEHYFGLLHDEWRARLNEQRL
ncbi:MAG TPA: GNAT family N-acetyltransferase [Ktedonobacterales bacterium]